MQRQNIYGKSELQKRYHVYLFSAIYFLLWHSIVFDLMNLARAFDPKLRGGIKGTYVGEGYMGKESLDKGMGTGGNLVFGILFFVTFRA